MSTIRKVIRSKDECYTFHKNGEVPLFTLALPIFEAATSERGPKTKKYFGKARQAYTVHTTQFILALLKLKITLANIYPCLAIFFCSVNGVLDLIKFYQKHVSDSIKPRPNNFKNTLSGTKLRILTPKRYSRSHFDFLRIKCKLSSFINVRMGSYVTLVLRHCF